MQSIRLFETRGRWCELGCLTLCSCLFVGCSGTPASEDEAVAALRAVEPLLVESDQSLLHEGDGLAMSAGAQHVSLPARATGWLSGDTLRRMRVPRARDAAPIAVNSNTVVYVGTDDATSSAVSLSMHQDSTVVEFSTILHDRSAPSEHELEIELRPGEQLVNDGDNRAHIEDAAGLVLGHVDAPWAKDAAGHDVPFTMSVRDNRIITSVPHREGQYVYPIVVDPSVTINCGIITCTAYFSRDTTRLFVAAPESACLRVPTQLARTLCLAAVVTEVSNAISCVAQNECMYFRFLRTGIVTGSGCTNGKYCYDQ